MIQKCLQIGNGVNGQFPKLLHSLGAIQQPLVEIAKAISTNAKILIMDEPSTPLSVEEVEKMFNIVRELKKNGVTIIYISHRLDELFEISDRVTVMRDETYFDTLETASTDRQELINLMVAGNSVKPIWRKLQHRRCFVGS